MLISLIIALLMVTSPFTCLIFPAESLTESTKGQRVQKKITDFYLKEERINVVQSARIWSAAQGIKYQEGMVDEKQVQETEQLFEYLDQAHNKKQKRLHKAKPPQVPTIAEKDEEYLEDEIEKMVYKKRK